MFPLVGKFKRAHVRMICLQPHRSPLGLSSFSPAESRISGNPLACDFRAEGSEAKRASRPQLLCSVLVKSSIGLSQLGSANILVDAEFEALLKAKLLWLHNVPFTHTRSIYQDVCTKFSGPMRIQVLGTSPKSQIGWLTVWLLSQSTFL